MEITTRAWQPAQAINYEELNAQRSLMNLSLSDNDENLFDRRLGGAGDSLNALELTVTVEGPHMITPITQFDESSLDPIVLENFRKCGYTRPTAIQGYCIPAVNSGVDIVAVAQTGSGKTAAYLAPIISSLIGKLDELGGPKVDARAADYDPERDKVVSEPLVLILCPTRELAMQISAETGRIASGSNLRTACVNGGTPVKYNLTQLGKGCDILIATPGRLVDLLGRGNVVSLSRLRFTVLDEADQMLNDPDWETDLTNIMGENGATDDESHHYLMFSATFPRNARKIAREYLQESYVRIRVGRAGSSHANVAQDIIYVEGNKKNEAVASYLHDMDQDLVIIFCNSKRTVDSLDDYLHRENFPVTFMHSDRSQFEREDAMRSFFKRTTPILITTAVVARGIDFAGVAVVINYDLPSTDYGGIDEYIHRIGRTGRIGHTGKAVSFYNERNEGLAADLVNVLLETGQTVPDFLEQYKHESGQATFHDDTDDEDEEDEEHAEESGSGGGGEEGEVDNNVWESEPAADAAPVQPVAQVHTNW